MKKRSDLEMEEDRLKELLDELKTSEKFDEYKTRTLGEFWLPEWPKAPFEEALTLKQLCGLDLSSLLRKKSFGPQKASCVLQVVEEIVARLNG